MVGTVLPVKGNQSIRRECGEWHKAGPLRLLELLGTVVPSIWQSFIQKGEMACITPAWSSGKLGLNSSKT